MTPYERGHIAGQISMRERAAKVCEEVRGPHKHNPYIDRAAYEAACDECNEAILSLPIVGEADQRGAAAQELPAVNSARPAASDSLSPELSSGEPVLSSSVIRDSAQQPAQSASHLTAIVPREIDREAHRHLLDVWNDCMENAETLETTWRRLVKAMLTAAQEEHDAHR